MRKHDSLSRSLSRELFQSEFRGSAVWHCESAGGRFSVNRYVFGEFGYQWSEAATAAVEKPRSGAACKTSKAELF